MTAILRVTFELKYDDGLEAGYEYDDGTPIVHATDKARAEQRWMTDGSLSLGDAVGDTEPIFELVDDRPIAPGEVKVRKLPIVYDAIQFTGDNLSDVGVFLGHLEESSGTGSSPVIQIETLEGTMLARPGSWIIRGIKGEYHPVESEIFKLTYEVLS